MTPLRASWEIDFADLVRRIVEAGIQPKAIARMLDVTTNCIGDWKCGHSEPGGRSALGLFMIDGEIDMAHYFMFNALQEATATSPRATLADAETATKHHAQLLRLYSERALCKLLRRGATTMLELEQHQRCSVETARRLSVAYRVHQRLLEALR